MRCLSIVTAIVVSVTPLLSAGIVRTWSEEGTLLPECVRLGFKPQQRYADPKPIFYVHIPKTGTSFQTTLTQYGCYPEELDRVPVYFGNWSNIFNVMKTTNNTVCPEGSFARFLHGHEFVKPQDRVQWKRHFVSVVREPIDRIISGFLHNLHDCRAMQKELGVQRDPREGERWQYLEHKELIIPYAECVRGFAARMLTGARPKQVRKEKAAVMGLALEMIQEDFAFIGLTDRWNETVCLWQTKFGGRYTTETFSNCRPSGEESAVVEELRQVLVNASFSDAVDEAIYAMAKKMFEDELRIYKEAS